MQLNQSNNYDVISLCIEEYNVSACLFDGTKVLLFTSYRDNFRFELTKKLLNSYNLNKIIIDSFIGIGPLINKGNINKFHKMPIAHKKKLFTQLSKSENSCLKALNSFCSHSELISVENIKILGYSGKYQIEMKNLNYFYIGDCLNVILSKSETLKDILKSCKTRFGKIILKKWIQQPLQDYLKIIERRDQLEFILPFLPKISNLLKTCKIMKVEQKINFNKLKTALKAVFNLDQILNETIKLQNHKKYVKIYKMLKIVNNMDENQELQANSTVIIESMAKELSLKFNISLSIVYFPQIGFLIESSFSIDKLIFKIKDKLYCKNKDMESLDLIIGDPYDMANRRETEIFTKCINKIRNANFTYLYDYIGNVDALASLAYKNCGEYAGLINQDSKLNTQLKNCDELESVLNENKSNKLDEKQINLPIRTESINNQNTIINGVELGNKNIICGNLDGIKMIETIILNQIGCKVPCNSTKLPIYKSLAYLEKQVYFFDIKNSYFQNEVMKSGVVFRESTKDTFCIIEDPFQSTSPMEGFSIFSNFIQKISAKNAIFSTKFDFDRCNELIEGKMLIFDQNTKYLREVNKYLLENEKLEEFNQLSNVSKWLLYKKSTSD